MEVTATIVGEASPVKIVHIHHDGGKIYMTYIDSTNVIKSREMSRNQADGITILGTSASNVP